MSSSLMSGIMGGSSGSGSAIGNVGDDPTAQQSSQLTEEAEQQQLELRRQAIEDGLVSTKLNNDNTKINSGFGIAKGIQY